MRDDAAVAIIGGGPVGLGLAIDLGQRGIDCILIEKSLAPAPIPKGQNLTQRTGEHFIAWNVRDEIAAARTIPHEYGAASMTAFGQMLSEYRYEWLARKAVRPFYATDHDRLPQYRTEAVLRRRLEALPSVQGCYGTAAVKLETDGPRPKVLLADRQKAPAGTITADYIIGSDGSRSLVRGEAGIAQDSDDHARQMVLLVFQSARLDAIMAETPGVATCNVMNPTLDGYWQFFGRVDPKGEFFFHAPVPQGTTKDNFDFHRFLEEIVGTELDCEFRHIGFWDLRIATARTYRRDSVFIAGDAAHSHPPYGGYGINTGFEDARNLGWKLQASLEGWAGPGLLDSYSEERRPVFLSTAEDFIARMIQDDRAFMRRHNPRRDRQAFEKAWEQRKAGSASEVFDFEPHYEGSKLVFGAKGAESSAKGRHEKRVRAGHHLSPARWSDGKTMDETIGRGFSLIALDAPDAVITEFEREARALSIPFRIVRDSQEQDRQDWQARLILVRPDHFVAWAGDTGPSSVRHVLRRSVGYNAPVNGN